MYAPNVLLVLLFFLLSLFAGHGAQHASPSVDPPVVGDKQQLFERVISNQKKNDRAQDFYERIERTEIRKGLADSQPAEVKITRLIPTGTGVARLPVGPDGQPLDRTAYRAELDKLAKALAWSLEEGRQQREAREKFTKKRKDRDDLIDATRSAFLFTFLAHEPRGNLTLSKYSMHPNPSYKPSSRTASLFTKVRGVVWIDEASGQLARIEGEVTDDLSLGIFLARVYQGSHFMQERYEVAPGVWLPTFSQYDFDGRKFWMSISVHERAFYSNYRFIGPPAAALVAIRAELGKLSFASGNP